MPNLTIQQLQAAIGGELIAETAICSAQPAMRGQVVVDSRQVKKGDLFWALKGSLNDGADFAGEAFARGALGVVAGRAIEPPAGRFAIHVHDGLWALQRLARTKRSQFKGQTVAVTGSVGKTTTRVMIEAVLNQAGQTTSSPHNYNNHVGLPLGLVELDDCHEFGVYELGASAPGEIAALADLCRPDIGVITCIGEAHLSGFGNREAVALAKTELLAALPRDGVAVLNGDDSWLRKLSHRSAARVLWIGRGSDCDLTATDITSSNGRLSLRIQGRRFVTHVWGRHHVTSMLAAVAAGRIVGLADDQIADALMDIEAPAMRCQVSKVRGATVINDAYNASPTAMRAALTLLSEVNTAGRRVVVCGDMRELGPTSSGWHRQAGNEIVTLGGADVLIACGNYAADVVVGARRAGMQPDQTIALREPIEAAARLHELLEPGDVVLVKGSRAMGLERVIEGLTTREHRRAA
jgi:UDP-N-acetylmuramoyl-tripeptide--D-alanyl-D-alanine ligase